MRTTRLAFCGLWGGLRPHIDSAVMGKTEAHQDDVEAIGLAEQHKCGFLWKLG